MQFFSRVLTGETGLGEVISTGSSSDRVSTLHMIEIAKKRPGRYRSRY
jgi:hypothetical protein